MKPLLSKNLTSFCQRFDNFKDAELRSLEVLSKDVIRVVIATQDSNRDFDWISIALEFSGVSDAKLIEDAKISLLDMSDGFTLFFKDNYFVFANGEHNSISGIKNALCYIISSSIKYKEGQF